MRSRRWTLLPAAALLAAVLFGLANSRGVAQQQAAKNVMVWEYKTLFWNGGDPTPSFNELGQEGWELVTSRGYGDRGNSQTAYVFKRAKP